jgi:TetR/AcrR family transcriptional regulator, transcriptional repressor of bet genes
VREICAQADVSPGLLRHYFDSKGALILEAFRTLSREFRKDLRSVLKDPGLSAQARIEALLDTYLSSQLNDEERASTYLAFWALARTDPTLRRAQRAAYRELRRLIQPALAELMLARGATLDEQQAVIGLIALLDGLWLERYIDRKAFSRAKARAIAWRWLDVLLGSSPPRQR